MITKYITLILIACSITASAQNYADALALHRANYKQDFLKSERSPLKQADLINLRFYAPDSTFCINANIEVLTGEKPFNMVTYTGHLKPYIKYAVARFKLNGEMQQLIIYKNLRLAELPQYKTHLFMPFTDATNMQSTYPGGRYIDLNSDDIKNGILEIDFNKAYNPYCAYSDGYVCPKPPAENALQLSITAGEMNFAAEKKH